MSAITALTAQNTTGVTSILNADSKFLGEELDAVFTDIYPDAVKIGMVSESDLIHIIVLIDYFLYCHFKVRSCILYIFLRKQKI